MMQPDAARRTSGSAEFDPLVGLPSGRWSGQSSQEQARRNAMAACTVLAARRLERLEVEEYVAEQLAQRAARSASDAPARRGGRLTGPSHRPGSRRSPAVCGSPGDLEPPNPSRAGGLRHT